MDTKIWNRLNFNILCVLLLLHFVGSAQTVYVHIVGSERPLKFQTELKKIIVENGDTISYEKLKSTYKDTIELREDFFMYALIMSEIFNYQQAYYDVFSCIVDFYPFKTREMDNETANLAITFLLKASEQGHSKAKEIIDKYLIVANSKNDSKQIERIIKGEGIPLYW